jgi:hypothetical protein
MPNERLLKGGSTVAPKAKLTLQFVKIKLDNNTHGLNFNIDILYIV